MVERAAAGNGPRRTNGPSFIRNRMLNGFLHTGTLSSPKKSERMTIDPSVPAGGFAGRQPISDEEVRKLRRQMWADGTISTEEASRLFALNEQNAPSSEWTDFFVEALCDYLMARGQPRGYVTQSDAIWLEHHISRDGRVDSHAELELLVKLLERADSVPETLKEFALAQIEQIVLSGSGPTRHGGTIEPGRIDDAEVALLRRMIFAPAGDGPAKVSRAEAEMLFRLKDATLGAANAADWPRLFVQGVANHLMAHQSFVPTAEIATRMETPYQPNPLGFVFNRLGRERASPTEVRAVLDGEDLGDDKRAAARRAAVAADAQVTGDEAGWLHRLFEADGARDDLEQALLDFLAEDGARPF
jgi:hypothetical protein